MKKARVTFLAFAAATLLPAAFQAVVFPLSGNRDLQSVLGTFFVASYIAAASMILLGVPAYIVLKRFGLVTWWSAVSWGAVAGMLVILAIESSFEPASQLRFALLGGITGFLFWVIWKRGQK